MTWGVHGREGALRRPYLNPATLALVVVYIATLSIAILSTNIGIILYSHIPVEQGAAFFISIVLSGSVLLILCVVGLGISMYQSNQSTGDSMLQGSLEDDHMTV